MEKKNKSELLCDSFLDYYHKYEQMKKDGERNFSHLSPFEDDNVEFLIYQKELEQIKISADSAIYDLYFQSIEDDFYFHDCPLEVYKTNYLKRFEDFKKQNVDAEEIDFLKKEISSLIIPDVYDKLIFIFPYGEFMTNDLCFEISKNKKIEYLKQKVLDLGWLCEEQPDENVQIGYDEYGWQPQPPIFTKLKVNKNDVDNLPLKKTKQLTSNQIVILLDRIGFFEESKIKLAPKTKQAKLISLLVGLHDKNIKTNINKLENKPSANGENYQKDLELIDNLFNDL